MALSVDKGVLEQGIIVVSEVLHFVIDDQFHIEILKFIVQLCFEEGDIPEVIRLLELLVDDQGIKLLIP